MENWVLAIAYSEDRLKEISQIWQGYNISFFHVNNVAEAEIELKNRNYACIIVCSDRVNPSTPMSVLHKARPIPLIFLSEGFEERARDVFIRIMANEYMRMTYPEKYATSSDQLKSALSIRNREDAPITLLTDHDILVCVEYRDVFIRNNKVELARKEFDILLLLMSNKKRVYTFEMIFEHIWKDEYDQEVNKSIHNHVSTLRMKMKYHAPGREYIHNVHGVGYKFDTR